MKVLFVSSGNVSSGISPIIRNQGESLKGEGIQIDYFTVKGKGLTGYSRNLFRLRRHLSQNHYDLIHSHFFLSSVIPSLSSLKPLVVSLMGSDVYTSKYYNSLIRTFARLRWGATIVKSDKMKDTVGMDNVHVIPNGVDLSTFVPSDKQAARKTLGLDQGKNYILFASDPARAEKNFLLARDSIEKTKDQAELLVVYGKDRELIPVYLNSADVLLLTSRYEGSPNIVKEAMACGCPIVSTDVGDVKWLVGDIEGCFVTSFEPGDVAEKIGNALEFSKRSGRTRGRDRIVEVGLASETIAGRILAIYREVLNIRDNKTVEPDRSVAGCRAEGRSW